MHYILRRSLIFSVINVKQIIILSMLQIFEPTKGGLRLSRRGALSLIKKKCNTNEKLDEVTTLPPAVLEPQGSVVPATTEGGTKEVIAAEFLCQRKKEM